MADFLEFSLEFLRSLGFKESSAQIVITVLGLVFSMGIVGYTISWFQFRKRSFFDQMTVGINMIECPVDKRPILKLRTLIEGNLDTLLDNPILQKLVQKAAKKCTEKDPILRLSNLKDHALLITKLQNVISSIFAREHVMQMLGHRFKSQWVDFAITCERYGGVKSTKIRVLVFTQEDIGRLTQPDFPEVAVEAAHHRDRVHTLRLILAEMRNERSAVCGRIEIPISGG